MVIFLFLLVCLFFYDAHFEGNKFYKDYISHDNTLVINGIFVAIIFFSHFFSYCSLLGPLDVPVKTLTLKLGQLMVAPFLFFSGYGIYEQIKKRKNTYIKNFVKKRILPTYIHFLVTLIPYFILIFILHKSYSVRHILYTLIGWKSIGNSNWFMFDTFALYGIIYLCFRYFPGTKKEKICMVTLFSILLLQFLSLKKEVYWFDTILCFSAGIWYSMYKEKIEQFVTKNNGRYLFILVSSILIFIGLYLHRVSPYIHNILSIIFVFIILLVSMKIHSHNKILTFLGKNTFWIYILQRIPMILFQPYLSHYIILYFLVSLVMTFLLKILIKDILVKQLKI